MAKSRRNFLKTAAAGAAAFVAKPGIEGAQQAEAEYGCYECHGTVGQGAQANPLAPKLAPRPLPLPALIAYVLKLERVLQRKLHFPCRLRGQDLTEQVVADVHECRDRTRYRIG